MATVTLTSGKIKGFVTKTNPETVDVHTFKSVPIGKFKRFQKPEPFGSWDDVKDCTALTPRKVSLSCRSQATNHSQQEQAYKQTIQRVYQSRELEELVSKPELTACFPVQDTQIKNQLKISPNPTDEYLYGSVFTTDTTGKKPVMVWIHGGGWSMGNPEEYNGTPLAGTGENTGISIIYL